MRRLRNGVLAFLLAAVAAFCQQTVFYVSKKGNDTWTGKLAAPNKSNSDGPFATMERARDAVRALKQQGSGASIQLRGGVYHVERGLELGAEDSGTAASPVVWGAYPGEKVRLLGGRIVTRFRPVKDKAVLMRLDRAARKNVVECDLAGFIAADVPGLQSRGFGRPTTPAHVELFFGGRRMTVARWPNDGNAKIAAVDKATSQDDEHGRFIGKLEAGFLYEGDRPSRWKSTDDVWIHGYWAWDWANSYEQIESIDLQKRLIKTKPPRGHYGFRVGQHYYFLNILEELDQAGEYFVDRKAKKLYFWPPTPLAKGEAAISLLAESVVRIRDASQVTIRDWSIEYTRGNGIEVHGGEGIKLAGLKIGNIGDNGIIIDGGKSHSVVGCDIYQLGDGGVRLEGGNRKTLAPAGHAALNNHIWKMGEWSKTYTPAILITGVGNRIAHNLIHDGPHNAIQLSGNEHLIEFNEIHHVCLETGDVGAFYMGRDWTQRGNQIRHNYFHETGGVGMGSMGVYLDDCSGGATIFGNVFYKVQRAMFIGGGRDNLVENNIFVDCNPAVQIDARGLDPRPVWQNMVNKTMKGWLDDMNPDSPPYSVRYPELAQLKKYYAEGKGVPPEGNRIIRNVCRGKWTQIGWRADPGIIEVRDNLVDQDPLFVDPAKLNFQLRDESPAYKLGFQRIPMEKIGNYKDEFRGADRSLTVAAR